MPSETVWVTLVGATGAILTTASWVPQVFKAYRTRHLADFSWTTLLGLGVGVLAWLVYGVFRADVIIMGANAFTFVCLAALSAMKFAYRAHAR